VGKVARAWGWPP